MLHAYMDDSGTHDSSYSCVVAGYFGGVNRWLEFERSWGRVLSKYNIPEFHARVFWRRKPSGQGVKEYDGWSRKRLDEFLDALLRVIEDTAIYPFASGVLRSEWQKLTLRERKILSGGVLRRLANASTRPVFLPLQHCITRVTTYCKPGIRVNFIFDEDEQTTPWASECHRLLKVDVFADNPDFLSRCGDLTFADSERALPLQAADLLAYEANQYCKAAGSDQLFPVGLVYRRALKRIRSRDDFWLFDRPRLQSIIPRSLDEKKN